MYFLQFSLLNLQTLISFLQVNPSVKLLRKRIIRSAQLLIAIGYEKKEKKVEGSSPKLFGAVESSSSCPNAKLHSKKVSSPDIVWNKTWLFSKVLRRERQLLETEFCWGVGRRKVKAPTIVARKTAMKVLAAHPPQESFIPVTPPNTMLWNASQQQWLKIYICALKKKNFGTKTAGLEQVSFQVLF